jgi:hypothetical protein
METLLFESKESFVLIDLAEVKTMEAMVLQADSNDIYLVEGSLDKKKWSTLWEVPPIPKVGLRTRSITFPTSVQAKYVRLKTQDGDDSFSVSRFASYCKRPEIFPPVLQEISQEGSIVDRYAFLSVEVMRTIKIFVALLGVFLLTLLFIERRIGKLPKNIRLRNALFLGLGLFAGLCWWNLLHFHHNSYVHYHEMYHYYMGSKYTKELSYSFLYFCSNVADIEAGYEESVKGRVVRNLWDNQLQDTQMVFTQPEICTQRFSKERWSMFQEDNSYFRENLGDSWPKALGDHGYNPSPVWGIMGNLLSNTGPVTDTKVFMLALLDPLLLILMWFMVWRAFGWKAMSVAMIYWGTNFPAWFWWNGGGFLRQDWLALSVIGLCFLRQKKLGLAGFMLTWAGLLRIFPFVFLAGLIIKIILDVVRNKQFFPDKRYVRLGAGILVALMIFLPASILVSRNTHIWPPFAHNIVKHLDSSMTNTMGLKTVLSYKHQYRGSQTRDSTLRDPYLKWKVHRKETFQSRKWLFTLFCLGFFILFCRSIRAQDDWVACTLSVGFMVLYTESLCYYYSILLVYGLLWPKRESVGIFLCAYSAVCWYFTGVSDAYDEIYVWISGVTIPFIFYFTYACGPQKSLMDPPALEA